MKKLMFSLVLVSLVLCVANNAMAWDRCRWLPQKTYWINVFDDGDVEWVSNREVIDVVHQGPGDWRIRFDKRYDEGDYSTCSAQVTIIGNPFDGGNVFGQRLGTAGFTNSPPNERIKVQTYVFQNNAKGDNQKFFQRDMPFSLVVHCIKQECANISVSD